ncbi:MAG: lysine--tRNA ligase [Candidatus Hadarchaeales archaeon]
MHWVDIAADALLKRGNRHTIASGISISGHIHIGHANDVFIADAVRRAVEEKGGEAEAIWYADDYDPMRRVPWPLNEGELLEKYKRYLGFPYSNIPSPDPSFRSFVDYFQRPFVQALHRYGIKVKVYSGAEAYRSGRMAEFIRRALENSERIREILNRYRDRKLPKGWLPFDPICHNCGRISTTVAISWHGDYVQYRCEGAQYVAGCGHEGEADYTRGEGKLTWRVEWPARWKMLGVSCEPFGKDHAVVGGSYDTGKLIAKEVFGCEAPYPIIYEWMSLRGKRLSSSRGVIFTLEEWLEVAEPELLRYFIFRSKPTKSKEFDPEVSLIDLYEEYDLAEEVYFTKVGPPSRVEQLSRIYELSQVQAPPEKKPQRISFRLAAILAQVAADENKIKDILIARKILISPTEADVQLAMRRIELARHWVEKYAPPHMKFSVAATLPDEAQVLSPEQKRGLAKLAEILLEEIPPADLHNKIYDVARDVGMEPQKLFEAIYLSLLGKTYGPRAGAFISALDRDFVRSRFMEAAR